MKSGKATFSRQLFSALALTAALALQFSAQSPSGLSPAEKNLTRTIKTKEIKRITSELSSDKYEGRGMLQRGGDLAAGWIADEMKRIGLKPLGDNGGFLQSAPFVETVFSDATSVKVGGEKLVYARDWSAPGLFVDLDVTAPLVFVGHGLVSQNLGRDDLKNVDLKGKIAVFIEGRPANVAADRWDAETSGGKQFVTLIQRGVAGIISLSNGLELYNRKFIIDMTARRNISTPEGAKLTSPLPLIYLSDEAAEKLFAGSGLSRKAAFDAADRGDFNPIELKQTFAVSLKSKRTEGNAFNVIGYLEGSDPVLKSEAVAFTAHYDAYGLMNGKIYNGAADNAIGNGEMLAVAIAFSKMKVKPKRSLLFISMMGEEAGLLGSKYWVANPTWKLAMIAAVMNLDGIGTEIMGPVKQMIGYGAPYSTLGPMFKSVAGSYGIGLLDDPIPEQGVFKRSDHYSFVERGVPGLMLVGSPEATKEGFAKRFNEFENTKYHQPSDDIYKDWNWEGAKTVSDMMAILGYRVAQQAEMPSFLDGNPYSGLKRGDKLP